ncbi:substrate-binding domain-containing protein [Saccharothrix variisporea]|uniref:Extracellular solute-binding protein n=1 Tax=Saccharothrix variisporea TaxID=543527 RepID=A0A495X8H2_9PSEU|nr:substrate-binding domain-containing protein [Saccharothrix variisporea]RKT69909.1 extracellular solute-binding protein [Saccharothrix variisporea]
MGTPRPAVHRTILAVDVSGFGARGRTEQEAVRRGLYEALVRAFAECGIPWTDDWDGTYHEDRGDGLFVLVPHGVPNGRVVGSLPHVLAGQLRRHNKAAAEDAVIRLRAAITSGEVSSDGNGVMGDGLVLAFRLLESTALREELRRRPGELALIVSDRFYRDVVRDDPVCDPDSYREVAVDVKEVHGKAWISRPDHPKPEPRRRLPRPRWSVVSLVPLLAVLLSCDALAARAPAALPCPEPVQVNVLSSAEKADVVRRLAADFTDAYRDPTGCKRARVHVTSRPSAAAVSAIGEGWTDNDLAANGPEPHVWLPDVRWEPAEAQRLLHDGDGNVELVHRGTVAHSPLVLGVAPNRATADGSFRWRDLGAFRLTAVDPAASGAGLAAAVAVVRAELGATALDDPTSARRLREAALRTTAGPVCPDATGAVLASEKAVGRDELRCLVPLYPVEGTIDLDHPFVEVRRANRPPNERRAAAVTAFLAHLLTDGGQASFRSAGFRDVNWDPGLRERVRRGKPPLLEPVVDPDPAAVRAAWRAASGGKGVVLAVEGAPARALADRIAALAPDAPRLEFTPETAAGVVAEAVRRHGSGRPVVVIASTPTPARPGPVVDGSIEVHGVGLVGGACAATSQLGAFDAAYPGDCTDAADAERALDWVADRLWGAR